MSEMKPFIVAVARADADALKEHIGPISQADVDSLLKSELNYGDSWKKRGGIGAYMMLARKWDRIEQCVKEVPKMDDNERPLGDRFDIFDHLIADGRAEGLMDDVRDLRRYLTLVEAEMRRLGYVVSEVKK
jgi:hypothetical protein